jgi:Leucine-rich repeat (LRR) protein
MTPTIAHNAYRKLEAAHAAAGEVVAEALESGNLKALTSSTELLRRTTAEFREALERDLVEVPGKGRLLRAEYEALQQLARENQIDFSKVLNGIGKIEGGRVRGLALSSLGLTSVTALAKLTGLTGLYLNNNQLTDITPLVKLSGLTELYLSGNQLTDITPLAKLTGLKVLWLNYNNLTDITALAKLTGLTEIGLSNNQLTDTTPLRTLTGLRSLGISNNWLITPANDAVLTALKAKGCNIF